MLVPGAEGKPSSILRMLLLLPQSLKAVSATCGKNLTSEVFFMVSALASIPTILATALVWAVGLFLDFEFVPEAVTWQQPSSSSQRSNVM